MIRSLVRWFGSLGRSGGTACGARGARQFTPRLEALEGRALPAVFFGAGVGSVTVPAALLSAHVSAGHDLTVPGGSKPVTNAGGSAQSVGSEVTLLGGSKVSTAS